MQLHKIPQLYLSADHIETNFAGPWSQQWDHSRELPEGNQLIERLPDLDSISKIAVLVEDDLLRPIRIQLEKKVARRDLGRFLAWKLKRLLPYPVDQSVLRHIPLAEPLTYLMLALPQPWVESIHQAFARHGVQCGFISNLFHSLTSSLLVKGKTSLWFFRDFYLCATLDSKGALLRYRLRKLPLNQQQHLDLDTLLQSDLPPLLDQNDMPLQLICMSHKWDDLMNDTRIGLANLSANTHFEAMSGSHLSRVQYILTTTGAA